MNLRRINGRMNELTSENNIREFRKLQRLLQRKRRFKIELCVGLSVLRLFQVGRFVQSRRTAHSLAWHEWFSRKGKEWKVYSFALSSEPQT